MSLGNTPSRRFRPYAGTWKAPGNPVTIFKSVSFSWLSHPSLTGSQHPSVVKNPCPSLGTSIPQTLFIELKKLFYTRGDRPRGERAAEGWGSPAQHAAFPRRPMPFSFGKIRAPYLTLPPSHCREKQVTDLSICAYNQMLSPALLHEWWWWWCLVAKLCPTLLQPHGQYSLPVSSVHGISQARRLEWVAISFSRESSWPKDQTHGSYISCIACGFFTTTPPRNPNDIMATIYWHLFSAELNSLSYYCNSYSLWLLLPFYRWTNRGLIRKPAEQALASLKALVLLYMAVN